MRKNTKAEGGLPAEEGELDEAAQPLEAEQKTRFVAKTQSLFAPLSLERSTTRMNPETAQSVISVQQSRNSSLMPPSNASHRFLENSLT